MEFYSIVIVLLAIAIGLYPVAGKLKIPYPIVLLAAGIGVGFIPGFGGLSINPEVVFLIFLPPILYDAAFNITHGRRNGISSTGYHYFPDGHYSHYDADDTGIGITCINQVVENK